MPRSKCPNIQARESPKLNRLAPGKVTALRERITVLGRQDRTTLVIACLKMPAGTFFFFFWDGFAELDKCLCARACHLMGRDGQICSGAPIMYTFSLKIRAPLCNLNTFHLPHCLVRMLSYYPWRSGHLVYQDTFFPVWCFNSSLAELPLKVRTPCLSGHFFSCLMFQ